MKPRKALGQKAGAVRSINYLLYFRAHKKIKNKKQKNP